MRAHEGWISGTFYWGDTRFWRRGTLGNDLPGVRCVQASMPRAWPLIHSHKGSPTSHFFGLATVPFRGMGRDKCGERGMANAQG